MQFTRDKDPLLPSGLLGIFFFFLFFFYFTSRKRVGLNWVNVFLQQTHTVALHRSCQVTVQSAPVHSNEFNHFSLWHVDIIWSMFVSYCLQPTIPCDPLIHTIPLCLHDYLTLETIIIIRLLSLLFFPFALCLSNTHCFITCRHRRQWQCSQYP